ncbi:hypothetical protein Tco_0832538 [Tanacetum coccineum]
MVVRTLDVEKDPFRPPSNEEEILGPELPYLSAIRALLFLAVHTRPDISFSLNLLARYSSSQQIDIRMGISSGQEAPTVLHEDNIACIAQLKDEYIKGDIPKFFFTHDL